MTVKVKGTWKKDEREYNGVDTEAVRKDLIEHPYERRFAVISYDVAKVEMVVADGGTQIPQIALYQIEPVDGDDLEVVRAILDNRFRTRTGRNAQPSLFDTDDPGARQAADVLAGNLPKKEVKCGATSTHPEHEGDGWICRGLATTAADIAAGLTPGQSVAEAGAADSGRRELPAAPTFSDQDPDSPAEPKPARRSGGRRKQDSES